MQVTLFLNHACNLACGYCYNGAHFHRPMPEATAQAGIEMALTQGITNRPARVSFFGGEPLLEWDLVRRLVAYTKRRAAELDRRYRFEIVTNGLLLDAEKAAFLRAENFWLSLSIDGNRPAHDANRRDIKGQSSYDRVVTGLKNWAATHPKPLLRTHSVVDPSNVQHLAQSFAALRALDVKFVRFLINYAGAWDEAALSRLRTALVELGEAYVAAYRRGEIFSFDFLDSKIITHVKAGYSCGDKCDFGRDEVTVAPSGRLYPCDRLVGEDDKADLVIGDVVSGVDRARRDALLTEMNIEMDVCADCAIKDRCMHWCGCVNHSLTGAIGRANGTLCKLEQSLITQADACAEILYAERNPQFLQRFYGGLVGH